MKRHDNFSKSLVLICCCASFLEEIRKSKLSKRRMRAKSLTEQPSEAKVAMRAIRDSNEKHILASPPKIHRKTSPDKTKVEKPVKPVSPEKEDESAVTPERKDSLSRRKRLEARPLRRYQFWIFI